MKKIIGVCIVLNGFVHSADYKPQHQRRVECFNDLVQAFRDKRAQQHQLHSDFDISQRRRPIHEEHKATDSHQSDKEKKG